MQTVETRGEFCIGTTYTTAAFSFFCELPDISVKIYFENNINYVKEESFNLIFDQ